MRSKKRLLSDYQGNEEQLLRELEEKFEHAKVTIERIQKDIQLVTPLLDSYQGKEAEETAFARLDSHYREMKQDFTFIENAWQKVKALSKLAGNTEFKEAKLPTVNSPVNSSSFAEPYTHFSLIPSVTDENLIKLNAALQAYHSSPSKKALNEIIEACNQYIESIPFERRSRGSAKEAWGKVLPEWPHIERVFQIQKQAVSRLFLPEEKTDAKRRIKLFREIVGVENKSKYKGKILEKEFWGEYKFKGKKYIHFWLSDANSETSTYLRSYREWLEFHNQLEGRNKIEVTYFDEAGKITFEKGLVYLHGELLDHPREILFVMGMDGEIYVSLEHENTYDFHHSSFFSGNKVICAGMLLIEDGEIKLMTNESGHYMPRHKHLVRALEVLQEKHGLNLEEMSMMVKDFGRPDSEAINAFRFLKSKGFTLSEEDHAKAVELKNRRK